MKILLCAYACKPNVGSEAGVGWNWTRQLLNKGHHVTLMASPVCRVYLEKEAADTIANLKIIYVEVSSWKGSIPNSGARLYLYYLLWQWYAYKTAKRLDVTHRFDVAHQLTWGSIRFPSFLGRLRMPLVLGPMGGAESAPMALRASYPIKGKLKDLLRDVSNQLLRVDPLARMTFRQADAILLKTTDNLPYIPAGQRYKARIRSEIGIDVGDNAVTTRSALHILFAGRILYWKGIALLVDAFAQILTRHPDARLTVAGDGPDMHWLNKRIARLGIEGRVEMLGWVKKDTLQAAYSKNGIFLFPSLHDSSGNVVLEALSSGLPVVCLDIGGPASLLNEESAIRVPCLGASHVEVVRRLADAVCALIEDPERYAALTMGALSRARDMSWSSIVDAVYENDVEALIVPPSVPNPRF